MSTRGRLLVASPSLLDPNFARSVVFMLQDSEEGALGLVLNQPSELPVRELFEDWAERAAEPWQMFRGGPVSLSSVICLGVAPGERAPGFQPITDNIGTIDLDVDFAEQPDSLTVRLFAGYASWSPGQLDAELAESSWFVFDAETADILTPSPDELWWDVFGRQEGPERLLRNYPREPWDN